LGLDRIFLKKNWPIAHPKTTISHQKNTAFLSKITVSPSKITDFSSKTPLSYQNTSKHLKNAIFPLKNPHFPIKKNPKKTQKNPPKKNRYLGRKFFAAARANPQLYIEALFWKNRATCLVISTGDSDAGVARGAGCVNYEMTGGSGRSFWYRFGVIWRCIGRVTALLVKKIWNF
jgi:hypothetical protein